MLDKTYRVSHFDAIIFDLGAVIIDIDYAATINAFESLGIDNFNAIFSKAKQANFTDDFETGHITEDDFFEALNLRLGGKQNKQALINAWNTMLGLIPQNRIELLKACQNKLPTYLLSNTNFTHIKYIYSYIAKTFGVNNFEDWFTKVYLSFEVGMRKPNADIFEFVLHEIGLSASKILYIDDSPQHIQAARNLGITSHHLLDNEDVCDILQID